jgi:Holliday junction resolvase
MLVDSHINIPPTPVCAINICDIGCQPYWNNYHNETIINNILYLYHEKEETKLIFYMTTDSITWVNENQEEFKTKSALAIKKTKIWTLLPVELLKQIANEDFINEMFRTKQLEKVDTLIREGVAKAQKKKIDKIQESLMNILDLYKSTLIELETAQSAKIDENKKIFMDALPLFKQLRENKYLNNIVLTQQDEYTCIISFVWNPLQLEFFDLSQAQRWLNNPSTHINRDPSAIEFLKETLLEGKYKAFTAPISTEVKLELEDTKINMTWKTDPYKFHIFPSLLSSYYNIHVAVGDFKGCLGTFGPVLQRASVDLNLEQFILTILQFYKTINILDHSAGTPTFINNTIYTDKNNIIVYCPLNTSKVASYVGENIYDLVTEVEGGLL